MASSNVAIGHELATPFRVLSPTLETGSAGLSTVADLLNAVDPFRPKRLPMLWTTASHLSEMMNVVVSEMPIGMLRQALPDFGEWLKQRRYSPKSASTFQYNLRRLVARADELGWSDDDRALVEAWKPISEAMLTVRLAPRSASEFAIARRLHPAVFTGQDLDAWGEWRVARGRKYRTVRIQKGLFRQAVRRAGLEHLMPKLNVGRQYSTYGISTDKMPEPLRSQVNDLLIWKQAPFVRGRPQKTRHRAVSAKQFEEIIRRLYGFAVNVAQEHDVRSITDLFTEEIVGAYMEWAVNTRKLTRGSLLRLSMIYGALRHHPAYKNNDYSWFSALCDELPQDDWQAREARKARKKIPFSVLSSVPEKIRATARESSSSSQLAWAAHDELLMAWLTTLPWRQRNLRECRIGDPNSANVFYAPLDPFNRMAKPLWAEEMLNENRNRPIWQFYFRSDETKMGNVARGIIPRRLIPLLERYIEVHRPKLIGDKDPKTLFLNREGGPLDRQSFTELVGNLTRQHTGVRLTPHIARDVFSLAFLEEHRKDFLTLSKILFHADVRYTIRVYGSDFNESHGACAVDEWLGTSTRKP